MFGTFLTWLNDHESDVFLVATANDVSKLPPEFTRAERFDAVFMIELPTAAERMLIWRHYIAAYELTEAQRQEDPDVDDTDWTGAEIKACCRLAKLLDCDLFDASLNIVPVAVTAREKITALREWATGRCLSAATPGIYDCEAQTHHTLPAKPASRAIKRTHKARA